jgi:hypothetical protein
MATDIAFIGNLILIRESSTIVFENILNSISGNRRFRSDYGYCYILHETILWSNLFYALYNVIFCPKPHES